jgi:hypothetical protein
VFFHPLQRRVDPFTLGGNAGQANGLLRPFIVEQDIGPDRILRSHTLMCIILKLSWHQQVSSGFPKGPK